MNTLSAIIDNYVPADMQREITPRTPREPCALHERRGRFAYINGALGSVGVTGRPAAPGVSRGSRGRGQRAAATSFPPARTACKLHMFAGNGALLLWRCSMRGADRLRTWRH